MIDPRHIELPDAEMVPFMRQLPLEQRFAMIGKMWAFARDTIDLNLRRDHPEWTEEQIKRETARRLSHGRV